MVPAKSLLFKSKYVICVNNPISVGIELPLEEINFEELNDVVDTQVEILGTFKKSHATCSCSVDPTGTDGGIGSTGHTGTGVGTGTLIGTGIGTTRTGTGAGTDINNGAGAGTGTIKGTGT
jgi:hypothetical protein